MYGNFRNIGRAFKRGHLQVKDKGIAGQLTIYRRVKSDKLGAGDYTRWVKGFMKLGPQKWTAL